MGAAAVGLLGEGRVEKVGVRVADQRTSQRDALLLRGVQVGRSGIEHVGQCQELGNLADAVRQLGAVVATPQRRSEGEVVEDVELRVQRVVLEHHGEVTATGIDAVDHEIVDQDVPVALLLEADQDPQEQALARAAGTGDGEGGAGRDDEIDVVEQWTPTRSGLGEVTDFERGHR